jgi:hypothetical protein
MANEEIVEPSVEEEVSSAEQAPESPEESAEADEKVEVPEPKKEDPKVEKEEKPQPVKREVFSMPVAKAQEEKHKAIERTKREMEEKYNAEIEKLKAEFESKRSVSSDSSSNIIDEIAEKHGLEKSAARDLADAIKKSIPLPDFSKYDQILKEREIEGLKTSVSREFDERVARMVLQDNPNATPEHLREVKERVMELAFTEGYNTYRIEDIYKVRKEDFSFQNEMSAESPGGRTPGIASMKKLSDEDEIKLADSDPGAYERYLKWLSANESKFID